MAIFAIAVFTFNSVGLRQTYLAGASAGDIEAAATHGADPFDDRRIRSIERIDITIPERSVDSRGRFSRRLRQSQTLYCGEGLRSMLRVHRNAFFAA